MDKKDNLITILAEKEKTQTLLLETLDEIRAIINDVNYNHAERIDRVKYAFERLGRLKKKHKCLQED